MHNCVCQAVAIRWIGRGRNVTVDEVNVNDYDVELEPHHLSIRHLNVIVTQNVYVDKSCRYRPYSCNFLHRAIQTYKPQSEHAQSSQNARSCSVHSKDA